MAEIDAVRGSNGLKVVSTFSGCGGSCLGFEMAGYRILWANEFVPEARATYVQNHPGVILDDRDIRLVKAADILQATGLKSGELDVFEGSPPCSSFSTAGKRAKGWGETKKYSDVKQRSDDLFFEYARLLDGLQPKVFIAENVSGLVKGAAWGYFEQIIRALKRCGYRVKAKVLDAQWLGVPQKRARLIFMGVREDLELDPVHPKPLARRYSIRDALPAFKGVLQVGNPDHKQKPGNSFPRGAIVHAHESALTVCAGVGTMSGAPVRIFENGIPKRGALAEPRKFTIPEIKRLCGFPDDFILTGSFAQQWERCGRSVPPVMMFHVARTLRDEVFGKVCKLPAQAREARPT
jgi:DNA (cytosine-5)-methyltransferase 1